MLTVRNYSIFESFPECIAFISTYSYPAADFLWKKAGWNGIKEFMNITWEQLVATGIPERR
jgi:hypothetical protein